MLYFENVYKSIKSIHNYKYRERYPRPYKHNIITVSRSTLNTWTNITANSVYQDQTAPTRIIGLL